jgi:GT2 family glycosyltransferase/glycosyltransferase involved in cell wall biosynthesis
VTYDFLVFPVIDWTFRLQRPQQIAIELGKRGHRVFYLTVGFGAGDLERPYVFWDTPSENVYVVQLRCPEPHPNIYKELPTAEQRAALLDALHALRTNCDFGPTVSIVDLPFWRDLATSLPGNFVVYDCMDYHAGFLNNQRVMLEQEDRLIADADLVLTSSAGLSETVGRLRPNTLIRNACDVAHFLPRPERPIQPFSARPVVGYFGAIDHWYDMELVIKAARAYPDWDFVLIGSSHGCNTESAGRQPNIRFLGEMPYAVLPQYVHSFDVCIIPFHITELTIHTNPVKMYEYLAAGKPVVGTAMPEIMIGGEGLVYVGHTHEEFVAQLANAMRERDNPIFIEQRIAYAQSQTWGNRVAHLEQAVRDGFPRVSVVVLTYNNLALTQKCLTSLEHYSQYPELELILVDNASSDDTPGWLNEWAQSRPNTKLILNERNLGFSAGNNVGLRVATGAYIVLLNNDTQVTQGWVLDLLRHMQRDPNLGLVGPVTNNIGNAAKIELGYESYEQMRERARRFVQERRMHELESDTVAFFCAMLSREVYEKVGELDEIFTVGSFEDDDFCRRVQGAGYRIAIADDVFVHHELSAALNQLGAERRQQVFEHHKRLYEAKWGPWIPHRYRDAPAATAERAQSS